MELLTELQLQIPDRMKKRLTAEGDKWNNAVFTVFQKAKNHFCNDPVFFPYYTFHGVSHINVVLKFADKLIPDGTMKRLNGKSVFILISGIILHDLGMHLRVPGAKRIIYGDWSSKKADRIKGTTFETAWNNYLDEVRHFSEEKMLYHFGMEVVTESPDLDRREVLKNDQLLVGEFLRRYHHVLAQEVQESGFPVGAEKTHLIFDTTEEVFFSMSDEWGLAGILALSHGVSIRDAERTVYSRFGNRNDNPCNVPIFYLIAVLRMADYLDAGEHRVPVVYSEEDKVPVPISASEWNWNELINADSFTWEDKRENLRIQANPKRSIDFIQLEKWLHQVQQELDLSWAAIAEYYGTGMWDLSIHRIVCNILDPDVRKGYEKLFLTKEARLTANPEIIKLMIKPLYGSDPSYGVRELIQNAVDACNERKHLEQKKGKVGYCGKIKIELDSEVCTFSITDNGIGMDEDTILNYYLSAGSSYRCSDWWFSNFTTEKKPDIVRNGRFGVGALAAFLLGSPIQVTTRKNGKEYGYRFEYGIESIPLNIGCVSDCPIGTTIQIKLSKEIMDTLVKHFDDEYGWTQWYFFEEPEIECRIDGEVYFQGDTYPGDGQTYSDWFVFKKTKYESFQWKHTFRDNLSDSIAFCCNGIRIPESPIREYRYDNLTVCSPCVSVIDKSGSMPLDLARMRLYDFCEKNELEREVVRFLIAVLLTEAWSTEEDARRNFTEGVRGIFAVTSDFWPVPYLCSPTAYRPFGQAFLNKGEDFHFLRMVRMSDAPMKNVVANIKKMNAKLPFLVDPGTFEATSSLVQDYYPLISGCGIRPRRFWMDWFKYKSFQDIHSGEMECYKEEEYIGAGIMCEQKRIYEQAAPFLQEHWDPSVIAAIAEIKISACAMEKHMSIANNMLRTELTRYFGSNFWIPYDMEARRKKFPKAFEELKYYIDRILADREKERGVT